MRRARRPMTAPKKSRRPALTSCPSAREEMTGRREEAPLGFARLFAKVPRQHLPRVIFRTFHWLFQIQLAVGSASSPMLTVRA